MQKNIPGKPKLQNAALPFLLTLVHSKTPLSYPWGNENTAGKKISLSNWIATETLVSSLDGVYCSLLVLSLTYILRGESTLFNKEL